MEAQKTALHALIDAADALLSNEEHALSGGMRSYRKGSPTWQLWEDLRVATERAARAPSSGDAPEARWIPVSERLPDCDGERVFIGVNSAGFVGAFNRYGVLMGHYVSCYYETAEGTLDVMNDLARWMPLPPGEPSGAQKPDSVHLTSASSEGLQTALPVRSAQDYAIEHAEYMAVDAERLIDAVNDLAKARQEFEDGTANASDVVAAEDSVSEAQTALRDGIYEFRKRRDRAACEASAGAQKPNDLNPVSSPVAVPGEDQTGRGDA